MSNTMMTESSYANFRGLEGLRVNLDAIPDETTRSHCVDILESTRNFMQLKDPKSGRRMSPAEWTFRLEECAKGRDFYEFCGFGGKDLVSIHEAVGTADMTTLFGNVLDREMLARFSTYDSGMRAICSTRPVADFRANEILDVEYLRSPLQANDENKAVKEDNTITSTTANWKLSVYEKAFALSWQTLITDNMGVFSRIPMLLTEAARATENYKITGTYVNSSGPIDAVFSIATGTAAYSINALKAAFALMASQSIDTPNGTVPMMALPKYLVVPTYAMKMEAENDLASPNLLYAVTKDTAIGYPTGNIVSKLNLQVVYDPYLPLINTTSGTTNWFLFVDPNSTPALEFGVLNGYEQPVLFMEAPTKMRIGGGLASPFEGSFATNTVRYKVMYPMQCAIAQAKAAYASTGAA